MKINFLAVLFNLLKEILFWDGKEKQVFLFCHRSSYKNETTLHPYKILEADESDYTHRSSGYCQIDKPFIDRVYNEAIAEQADIIKVHSHPPGYPAIFSPIDEEKDPELLRHISAQIEGIQLVSIVFDPTFKSVDGWYYDRENDAMLPVEKISVIKESDLDILLPERSSLYQKPFDPVLGRTAAAFGTDRVMKIGCLTIGIVGLGGIGSALYETIARDKPQRIILCDPDVIEKSNLNRIYGATKKDIGRYKAEFYAGQIKKISPDTPVIFFNKSLYDPEVQQAFTQAEIIFGCVDSGARLSINQLSMAHNIPYFDLGASIVSDKGSPEYIGGQIYTCIPGNNACLSCAGCFNHLLSEYRSPLERKADAEQGYIKGEDVINPLVAYLDQIIAGLGYSEFIKYVFGLTEKPAFKVYYDALKNKLVSSNCETESCIVCHKDGFLGKGNKVPFLTPKEDKEDRNLLTVLESTE